MHRAEARRILGVADSATQEELRAAYRREALRTHPDKNPTRVQEATEQFRRVYEAYDLLRQDRPVPEERQGNAERPERPSRQGADEQRERGGAGPSFAEAKTFFQEVFGNAVVPVMTVTGATLEAWPAVRTAARVVASVGPPVALGLGGLAVGAIGVAAAAQIFSRESAIDFHSRCDREGDELRAAHTRAQQVLAELKGAKERARQRVTAL